MRTTLEDCRIEHCYKDKYSNCNKKKSGLNLFFLYTYIFCRYTQMESSIILWTDWMRRRVTGCVMWIQLIPSMNRTLLPAKTAWTSISTPWRPFLQTKSYWCGTALSLPTVSTTLPLERLWCKNSVSSQKIHIFDASVCHRPGQIFVPCYLSLNQEKHAFPTIEIDSVSTVQTHQLLTFHLC